MIAHGGDWLVAALLATFTPSPVAAQMHRIGDDIGNDIAWAMTKKGFCHIRGINSQMITVRDWHGTRKAIFVVSIVCHGQNFSVSGGPVHPPTGKPRS